MRDGLGRERKKKGGGGGVRATKRQRHPGEQEAGHSKTFCFVSQ
jgi:hypothetical protein